MTTFEEQFAELFGKTPDGKKVTDRKFIKFSTPGESYFLVQTGEPGRKPQTIQVNGKDVPKSLVRPEAGKPFKPMASSDVPADTDPELVWVPPGDVFIPVKVVRHLDAGGKEVEGFEAFDAEWELKNGDFMKKFEEAMLENGTPAVVGTQYKIKSLQRTTKPYTYSVAMKAPKE